MYEMHLRPRPDTGRNISIRWNIEFELYLVKNIDQLSPHKTPSLPSQDDYMKEPNPSEDNQSNNNLLVDFGPPETAPRNKNVIINPFCREVDEDKQNLLDL